MSANRKQHFSLSTPPQGTLPTTLTSCTSLQTRNKSRAKGLGFAPFFCSSSAFSQDFSVLKPRQSHSHTGWCCGLGELVTPEFAALPTVRSELGVAVRGKCLKKRLSEHIRNSSFPPHLASCCTLPSPCNRCYTVMQWRTLIVLSLSQICVLSSWLLLESHFLFFF